MRIDFILLLTSYACFLCPQTSLLFFFFFRTTRTNIVYDQPKKFQVDERCFDGQRFGGFQFCSRLYLSMYLSRFPCFVFCLFVCFAFCLYNYMFFSDFGYVVVKLVQIDCDVMSVVVKEFSSIIVRTRASNYIR